VIDREQLLPHFRWLRGSRYLDQALGEAALAIELTALDCGGDMMRHGFAWLPADAVVEVLGLERFVREVRGLREAGEAYPKSFGQPATLDMLAYLEAHDRQDPQ